MEDHRSIYPQDMSCFLLNYIGHQQENYHYRAVYKLLLIGQRKTFSMSTEDNSTILGRGSSSDLYCRNIMVKSM